MLAAQNRAKQDGWYSVKNLANNEAEVFIYGVIGGSFFEEGTEALQFIKDLGAIDAPKVRIRINSPGGSVGDAVAIFNAIRTHPAETETVIDGHAFSAAAWVGLSANKVIASPHSRMMIHEPYDLMVGNPAELRQAADILDGMGDDIADALAEKAGGTRDEWRAKMRAETWFSDQEMVANKLADELAGSPRTSNTFDMGITALFRNTPSDLKPGAAAPVSEPAKADLLPGYLAFQKNRALLMGHG